MHSPSDLVRLSHEATERFRHLSLTGITDIDSLIAAVKRDLPSGVKVINASTPDELTLLVRNEDVATADA